MRSFLLPILRKPGYTAITVGSLALAVGVNTAIFSMVQALWLRPVQVPSPGRVVILYDKQSGGGEYRFLNTAEPLLRSSATLQHRGAELCRNPLMGDLAPHLSWQGVTPIHATAVTAGFFETIGVELRGRTFVPADDQPGAPASVIVSDHFWRTYLHASADALGRDVDLGEVHATVIGVAPPGFYGPRTGDAFDVWLSLGALPAARNLRRSVFESVVTVYGRLRDGASVADADVEAERLLADQHQVFFFRTLPEAAYPLEAQRGVGDDRRMLVLLVSTGALLLLIGCVNLVGLEVVRATRRRSEIAVRMSLGSSQARLTAMFLSESMGTMSIGIVLSLVVARWCLDGLRAFYLPSGLSILAVRPTIATSSWMLAITVVVLAIVVSTLVPVIRLSGKGPAVLLRASAPSLSRAAALRSTLFAGQVALSVVLLVGCLLLVRTVVKTLTLDLGFASNETLSVLVQPQILQFRDQAQAQRGDLYALRVAAFQDFRTRIQEAPGVVSAAFGGLPLNFSPLVRRPAVAAPFVRLQVGPGYARSAGLEILAGRDLEARDVNELNPRPVVVSASLAESHWPLTAALGQTFSVDSTRLVGTERQTVADTLQVVGIVRDAYRTSLRSQPAPIVYEASIPSPGPGSFVTEVVIRVRGSAQGAVPAVSALAREMFPNAVQTRVQTASDLIADQTQSERLSASLVSGLAVIGLVLVFVGASSLVALAVAARKRELGIRIALGAPLGQISRLVTATGMWPTLIGLGVGLTASVLLSRLLSALLFGVTHLDPFAYGTAFAAIAAGGLAACYLPARRVYQIDPIEILRAE
ncbi:MAG TPA: ABC transporter permease [Vicinamibacterales bacterium]|nr:ABC transporter permease [Vicinamibacterales bacterium]